MYEEMEDILVERRCALLVTWAGRTRVAFCGIFDMRCEDVVVGLLDLDATGGAGDPVCQLVGLRWLLGRNEHEELHSAADDMFRHGNLQFHVVEFDGDESNAG
jgi:hypothetical protein